jgi:hypothetical protein
VRAQLSAQSEHVHTVMWLQPWVADSPGAGSIEQATAASSRAAACVDRIPYMIYACYVPEQGGAGFCKDVQTGGRLSRGERT